MKVDCVTETSPFHNGTLIMRTLIVTLVIIALPHSRGWASAFAGSEAERWLMARKSLLHSCKLTVEGEYDSNGSHQMKRGVLLLCATNGSFTSEESSHVLVGDLMYEIQPRDIIIRRDTLESLPFYLDIVSQWDRLISSCSNLPRIKTSALGTTYGISNKTGYILLDVDPEGRPRAYQSRMQDVQSVYRRFIWGQGSSPLPGKIEASIVLNGVLYKTSIAIRYQPLNGECLVRIPNNFGRKLVHDQRYDEVLTYYAFDVLPDDDLIHGFRSTPGLLGTWNSAIESGSP